MLPRCARGIDEGKVNRLEQGLSKIGYRRDCGFEDRASEAIAVAGAAQLAVEGVGG